MKYSYDDEYLVQAFHFVGDTYSFSVLVSASPAELALFDMMLRSFGTFYMEDLKHDS